ncbi:photosynthetic complex assembly protein PuhC [Hoeflea alexandrii]|uniref:Phosphonoacetaldehyde hydrolase n=1 Tax=Hoeflea alexandrii TaxID=288436 RepID=A0ABT1CU65_9HYPH|nr:photosynthetic complex assembly protein PuhC [Hoeflea alexandrii]MCO6409708.1 phosphonoacetaldehyde hydrolase [Hoeflea alexandrii]
MNALSPHYPEADRGPQSPSRKARRFPRFPLVLGLGLLGFSIAATLFGMKTGIGTVLNVYGQPQAVRDIVIAGAHDTEITISDARTGEPIITLAPEEGGFVRGSLRALSRMRLMAETPEGLPYRLIRWENGSVSLSDTATGERIYLNAFGPDNAAAYAELLASRGNEKP